MFAMSMANMMAPMSVPEAKVLSLKSRRFTTGTSMVSSRQTKAPRPSTATTKVRTRSRSWNQS